MDKYFPVEDPVIIFAIVAFLILISPILLDRFKLPGMIGLLLSGAVLGPNALGILARDQSFILFGTVGLLYIMFMAALEIDLAVFKRYKNHSIIFGIFTFAFPQGIGFLVAYYLLGFNILAAILLASLFASHTLVSYPVVSRLGIVKNRAVTAAVGGTILTDTLALIVLAIIAGIKKGDMDDYFWYRLVISLFIYIMAIFYLLPVLGRWFFRNIAQDGVSEFVFILSVVFATASLSHLAGSEPVLGAFLAGLALNRLIPYNSTLLNRIKFTGDAIFVPFFLLSVGMLLDVRIFAGNLRSWVIAGGMLASVIVCKFLAAQMMRPVLKYDKNEASVLFGISIAQAAGTLAATIVGYEIGLFDDAVVNGVILMILVTCIIAPYVTNKYGSILAENSEEYLESSKKPNWRVMVALSKAETVSPMIELAQYLRNPSENHPVYPLYVIEDTDEIDVEIAQAERVLSKAVVQLSAADIPSCPLTRIDLNVTSGILRARREVRGSEIIISWADKLSATQMFFGSLLEKLLVDPYYTLIVSKITEPLNTCKRIIFVVPQTALQELSFVLAIRLVKRLANQLGVKLSVVSVKANKQVLDKLITSQKPVVKFFTISLLSWSRLYQTLDEIIVKGDMVVLCGMRRSMGVKKMALGNLFNQLARKYKNNMLLVHPAWPGEDVIENSEFELQSARTEFSPLVIHFKEDAFGDFIFKMLSESIKNSDTDQIEKLMEKLVSEALELLPGVVLVHAETELVSDSSVVIGINEEGLHCSCSDDNVYIGIMLLDPLGRDASTHLQNLASVARMFHSQEVIDTIINAKNTKEIKAIFASMSMDSN